MTYLPPFEIIKRNLDFQPGNGDPTVTLTYQELVNVLRMVLQGVRVGEDWYKREYEDIGRAIAEGRLPSAQHHFVNDGWLEGRRPYPMAVDDEWYRRQYADVAQFIREERLPSSQVHFDQDGYREGRRPSPP